ncbi:MAG: hypothetical protein H6548_09610 [Chitinophagales bacterium]|nr:hypothetical protein [Chitinophagales bacterium]HAE13794.1 hypothetical protein [Bacteroidota bacterium]MCB9022365.1 hypothetical protein [Chitinophagales bacterium]HPE97502.1 hypothetical protein [Chitinophagales bacterium]HPR28629.1 hypothetical protein [Chitinophagales bacterium]
MKRYLVIAVIPVILLIACGKEKKEVTFADVAPVIRENCMPCHRPGSAGPFSLISYDDMVRKAKTIVRVTQSGFMPPWPADPEYTHFAGERRLTEDQKELIRKWVEAGTPLGDTTLLSPPPHYPDGSMLGEPDLVVPFTDTIILPGDNDDHFFLVKVPFTTDQQRFIRTIEYIPGNKKLAHHMNANLIRYADGAKTNVFDGEKVIATDLTLTAESVNDRMKNKNDDGSYPVLVPLVCNYLPGVSPAIYPTGIGGYQINTTSAFFINDLHFGPSPVDTFEAGGYFNIFFMDTPPERPTYELLMGSLGETPVEPRLVIPANEIATFTTRYKVQDDMSLLTVNPHMHLLGKTFLAYALTPQQDTIRLIRIPEWDFRWQYFYTFQNPVHIPAGSEIIVEAGFDNTSDNPNNPYDPPRVIVERAHPWESMRTTNEMLQFIITYMPYRPGDEAIDLDHTSLNR